MRIRVDRERCVGAGMCVLTAADYFEQDDEDGRVVLLADEAEDCDTAIADAAALCPAGAITLR
ncbi:ferredoxin [Glycomyces harbinensis]|uniref:Ferredoxin n=1 Tax=Glycomyces harbinensis TaxID=58114 RepID=A0A1G6VNU0_9ACTN|nr:ferredoxin [Glycomyces harbinensis]SDD55201.1 ferredoxin [Glycomyces harbinensis]